MIAGLRRAYARILAWCSDSETILIARLEMLAGAVAAAAVPVAGFVVSVMAPFDWGSVLQPGISWRQGLMIGGAFFLKGAFGELARRHRATDL